MCTNLSCALDMFSTYYTHFFVLYLLCTSCYRVAIFDISKVRGEMTGLIDHDPTVDIIIVCYVVSINLYK
jgi:hypothetical protein